ncbi:MAG: hypothetical protein R3E90_02455 [Marinicella sp.]
MNQKYALLTTNIDIKGKAYEEIVGANLRGDRGEFLTPSECDENGSRNDKPKRD